MALGEEHRIALHAPGKALRNGLEEEAIRRAAGSGEELHMAGAAAAGRRALVEEDIDPATAAETGSTLPVEAEGEGTGRIALLGAADIGPVAEAGTVLAEKGIDRAEEDTGPEEADTGPVGEDIDLEEEGIGRSPGEAAVLRCVRLRSRCEAGR